MSAANDQVPTSNYSPSGVFELLMLKNSIRCVPYRWRHAVGLRSTGRRLIVAENVAPCVAARWWVQLSSGLPAGFLKDSKTVVSAATPPLRGLGRTLQVAWSHIRPTDGGSQMTRRRASHPLRGKLGARRAEQPAVDFRGCCL